MSNRDVKITLSGKDNASDDIRRVEKSLGNLGKSALAFGAGFIAADKAIQFATESLGEFLDAESQARKLDLTLRNLGAAAPVTASEVQRMADEIHRLTTFEDDAAIEASRLLLAVQGLTKQGFNQAMTVSADLAAMLGTDLPDAAGTLAKALADPAKGMKLLRGAGILLDADEKNLIKTMAETGTAADAMALLLETVAERVKGSAAEMRETTAGELEMMKKDWNDLKEWFGKNAIAPAIGGLAALTRETPERIAAEDRIRQIDAIPSAIRAVDDALQRLLGMEDSVAERARLQRQLRLLNFNDKVNARKQVAADRLDRAKENGASQTKFVGDFIGKALADTSNASGSLASQFGSAVSDYLGKFIKDMPTIAKKVPFREGDPVFDAMVKQQDARAKTRKDALRSFMGPTAPGLGATESRFLTRGTGATDPVVKELQANNRNQKEQTRELKEQNRQLGRLVAKRGLVPANFR